MSRGERGDAGSGSGSLPLIQIEEAEGGVRGNERGEWGRRSSRVRSGGGWADWTGLVGPAASWAVAQWGGGLLFPFFC